MATQSEYLKPAVAVAAVTDLGIVTLAAETVALTVLGCLLSAATAAAIEEG